MNRRELMGLGASTLLASLAPADLFASPSKRSRIVDLNSPGKNYLSLMKRGENGEVYRVGGAYWADLTSRQYRRTPRHPDFFFGGGAIPTGTVVNVVVTPWFSPGLASGEAFVRHPLYADRTWFDWTDPTGQDYRALVSKIPVVDYQSPLADTEAPWGRIQKALSVEGTFDYVELSPNAPAYARELYPDLPIGRG